jgi:hypothetical protein
VRPPSSIIGRTAWLPCRVTPVTFTLGLGTRVAMPSRFDIALNPERPEVGRAWGVRGTRSRHGSLRSLGNESTGSYLSRSGQGAAVQPSRRKERGSLPVGSRKTRVGAGHKGASRRRAAPRSQPGTDSCKLLGRCVCQHRCTASLYRCAGRHLQGQCSPALATKGPAPHRFANALAVQPEPRPLRKLLPSS